MGEILALRWLDVDFERRLVCVEQNDWRGIIGTTKGNRVRYIPMTVRLTEALRAHRHLRSPLVVVRPNNTPMTHSALVEALNRAERAAGLPLWSPHKLKHTFCSHLAMRGAAPLTLKELAAHKNLATTMRYTHVTEEAKGGRFVSSSRQLMLKLATYWTQGSRDRKAEWGEAVRW